MTRGDYEALAMRVPELSDLVAENNELLEQCGAVAAGNLERCDRIRENKEEFDRKLVVFRGLKNELTGTLNVARQLGMVLAT